MNRRSDRGTVAIEVVVLLPIVAVVAMMVLQLGVAGWTASQAQEAARQAARAQSLERDPHTAAERALPESLDVKDIDAGGGRVTLWVEVPKVSLLPRFTMKRSVAMP